MKKRLVSMITMCLVGLILAGCVQQEMPLQTTEVSRGDLIISVSAKEGNLKMCHKEYLSLRRVRIHCLKSYNSRGKLYFLPQQPPVWRSPRSFSPATLL